MRDKETSVKILSDIIKLSNKYPESIDWNKFKKESVKFESEFKTFLNPTNKIKEIFSNKNIFKNLTEIKNFMSHNFNYEIHERTTKGILSEITYFTMKYPEVIRKIEENVISKPIKRTSVPKQKKIIQEKVSQQKVVQPRANSWREWTSFESEDLKIYLMGLTLKQIKPKLGKLLTSSEKKLRKADLIDTIVKKIKKLKNHYKMGPG